MGGIIGLRSEAIETAMRMVKVPEKDQLSCFLSVKLMGRKIATMASIKKTN